jgi:hypothetical protein
MLGALADSTVDFRSSLVRRSITLGGVAWILATVQFAAAQVITAAAWNPP